MRERQLRIVGDDGEKSVGSGHDDCLSCDSRDAPQTCGDILSAHMLQSFDTGEGIGGRDITFLKISTVELATIAHAKNGSDFASCVEPEPVRVDEMCP